MRSSISINIKEIKINIKTNIVVNYFGLQCFYIKKQEQITNKISNFEIYIFWNIFNTLVIDEIFQCPPVCVHLQTNTGVSDNTNASKSFKVFTHIYS
jgi:hypothetical protein